VGQAFVAGIDIDSFFPSVGPEAVARLLRRSGLGAQCAKAVAWLTTLNNGLPQGAPTSPTLSNAFLFRFDLELDRYCRERRIVYSRYADDITMSGDNRHSLELAIRKAQKELVSIGLVINAEKTRIASRGGQQRVAGVVVNDKAQPPRSLRRMVRAMIHRAEHGLASDEELASVRGYVAYFNSYPALRDTPRMRGYQLTMRRLSGGATEL
jgi:retron-type reverse transcriptase